MKEKAITFIFRNPRILLMILTVLLTNSCQRSIQKADLVLLNGKIFTADKNFSTTNAVAIGGDKILETGTNDQIKRYVDKQTKIIDLAGKTVVPGLIDAHCHPEAASLSELEEEIPDLHSVQELLEWIERQTSVKKEGEWIILPKMFYVRFKDLRQPTLEELDKAAPSNPVFLDGSFGGLINTAAMKSSGIAKQSKHPGLVRDSENGQLTGFIRKSAYELLKIPEKKRYTPDEEIDALKAMFRKYNEYGITGVISGYGDLNNYYRYRELANKGKLTLRVVQNFLLPFNIRGSKKELVEALKTFPVVTNEGDEWVKTGSLKIFLDGGILTGTAYLREPWGEKAFDIYDIDDPDYRGILNYSRDDLINIVSAANESGWTFTAHCTGGGGVDLLLDVFEEINNVTAVADKRISIIHGNFFTDEAADKMNKLSILANVQAAWFYKDAMAMNKVLGDERIKTFNPYESMIKKGIVLCGGSDHMVKMDANTSVNPYNPFLAMWSMLTRKTEYGGVIGPDEAISREEALKMYTINNAYASFDEAIKGSIEPGKLADLAILSEDILTCPVDDVKNIKANMTIVGGKVVFSADPKF
jgi:predicted amidohydrolase YtcJ